MKKEMVNTTNIGGVISKIDNLKKEYIEDMEKYADEHRVSVVDKMGNEENIVKYNPMVVANSYFKPIFDDFSFVPQYTASELSILYHIYNEILVNVNDIIGFFPSSLTLFCKMVCIPLNDFKEMRNSSDTSIRNVVNRIFDDIEENNITLSQLGMANEKSTLFKLKSQNEVVEKTKPNVNISIKKTIDTSKIEGNIEQYAEFVEKYGE